MSQFIFKMPDLGEGTVEAEIVAWHTGPGDSVSEDQVIVEVMTDKAAVEVPSPVSGRVVSISGAPGDRIAVGSPLIVLDMATAEGDRADGTATLLARAGAPVPVSGPVSASASLTAATATEAANGAGAPPSNGAPVRPARVKASPATRRRAREAGIDLATVTGSGPGGRVVRTDLAQDAVGDHAVCFSAAAPPAGPRQTTEIRITGIRRLLAERMTETQRTVPHFAYVEEVDVTQLESLRVHLNDRLPRGAPRLTYLPLIVLALVRALESFPQCNTVYDAVRGLLIRHRAVHLGVATQTPDGLKVPVVHNAQALSVWDLAGAIRQVVERARSNQATREELIGSTITVTSLGRLGGIASTPVINVPEVAIIGINKAVERPMVLDGAVVVRRIMNLSSSFDHRFVDGYDAAAMIQALKEFLEHPATIFIPKATPP